MKSLVLGLLIVVSYVAFAQENDGEINGKFICGSVGSFERNNIGPLQKEIASKCDVNKPFSTSTEVHYNQRTDDFVYYSYCCTSK